MFNKTAALFKKIQPILLYTKCSTTMDIKTNHEQGQGHHKVKTQNVLFNSRKSTICICLDSEMCAKKGPSHK